MILLTGGSGLLGSEIKKLMDVYSPSHEEFDILNPHRIDAELIIHCAAYTDVDRAETERAKCYELNVNATRKLASFGIPMIYISTDSVFDGERGKYSEKDIPYPKNFYSLSKLLGENEVKEGVIIRCSGKAKPWAYRVACTDRFFSAEYVDETASKCCFSHYSAGRWAEISH